jgi:hypothetical protein
LTLAQPLIQRLALALAWAQMFRIQVSWWRREMVRVLALAESVQRARHMQQE